MPQPAPFDNPPARLRLRPSSTGVTNGPGRQGFKGLQRLLRALSDSFHDYCFDPGVGLDARVARDEALAGNNDVVEGDVLDGALGALAD